MAMSDKCSEILNFWFGDSFVHGMPTKNRSAFWFGAEPEVDAIINTRFSKDLHAAAAGDYDDWLSRPEGRLALIILLDQFPRNIYRGTVQAFAYDKQASRLCLDGLDLNHDQQLIPAYRSFYYMPLEHSESLALQQHCVELFNIFYEQANPLIAKTIKTNLEFAQQHLDIIKQFGRFPHRNAILGRHSSEQELAYLEQTKVNFGQG